MVREGEEEGEAEGEGEAEEEGRKVTAAAGTVQEGRRNDECRLSNGLRLLSCCLTCVWISMQAGRGSGHVSCS